jgi:hypothetical protein
MTNKVATVEEYLRSLPEDRRHVINAVRKAILKTLPKGYEECMNYGMIGYVVPHSLYPPGYHCNPKLPLPMGGLASQKNYFSVYAMCCYGNNANESWLRKAWVATGKKLDMGKCCIRFKSLDAVPLNVIGELFARVSVKDYIAMHEALISSRKPTKKPKSAPKKSAKK